MLTNKDADGALINTHPMIKELEEISKIPGIEVKYVNFETGKITVSVKNQAKTFQGVMDSLKFVSMVERMSIHAVDFESGNIVVEWHPQGLTFFPGGNLTAEEIKSLKAGKKIQAIKDIRQRTGLGLAESKKIADDGEQELIRRGVIAR